MVIAMPAVKRPKRRRQRTYLREWRKYRNMTQEQVAALIGYHHSNLLRVELGKTQFTQDLLEKLAEVYRCTPADLLSRDPEADTYSDVAPIVRRIASATPAQREQISAVIAALLNAKK